MGIRRRQPLLVIAAAANALALLAGAWLVWFEAARVANRFGAETMIALMVDPAVMAGGVSVPLLGLGQLLVALSLARRPEPSGS